MKRKASCKQSKMKKTIILIAALIISVISFAQMPGGMPPQGNGKGMQAPPSIGVVFGKLVDSAGKPVQDASVILMGNKMDTATKKFKQVMLKATTTKAAGSFRFEDLPIFGPLTLKISASGYQPIEKQFSIIEPSKTPGAPPAGGGSTTSPSRRRRIRPARRRRPAGAPHRPARHSTSVPST